MKGLNSGRRSLSLSYTFNARNKKLKKKNNKPAPLLIWITACLFIIAPIIVNNIPLSINLSNMKMNLFLSSGKANENKKQRYFKYKFSKT